METCSAKAVLYVYVSFVVCFYASFNSLPEGQVHQHLDYSHASLAELREWRQSKSHYECRIEIKLLLQDELSNIAVVLKFSDNGFQDRVGCKMEAQDDGVPAFWVSFH